MKKKLNIHQSLTIAIGCHNSGILEENKKHIKRYINSKLKDKHDYRVLIIDVNHEYKGSLVSINELRTFKNKVAVIRVDHSMTMEQKQKHVANIIAHYKNGLLIMDGYNKIFPSIRNMEVSAMLSCPRNFSRDAIISFQDPSTVPFKILQNTSFIRLHRTVTNFDQKKIADKYSELLPISNYVLKARGLFIGNRFVIIDNDNQQISGCSKADYLLGYSEYLKSKINKIKNIKQLGVFLNYCKPDKIYSDMKHIPISNILNTYTKQPHEN